jgi:hypothetical protein
MYPKHWQRVKSVIKNVSILSDYLGIIFNN